jgi:hypothetical protein
MLIYQRVNPIPSGKLSQNELERSTMLFSWVNYGKIHHAIFMAKPTISSRPWLQ